MNPEISVVIPLYNEERCLGANAAEVKAFLDARDSSWELILVNDGSRDRTLAIAARLAREDPRIRLISYGKNRGKGYAVRTGMLEARGRYRVFMDADLAVPVEYAGTCHDRLIQGAEVVIGSRHLPGACIQVPEEPLRQALGGIYRKMILAGFRLAVTDITCGLKGFPRRPRRRYFPGRRSNAGATTRSCSFWRENSVTGWRKFQCSGSIVSIPPCTWSRIPFEVSSR